MSLAAKGRKVKATVVDKNYRRSSKSGNAHYKIQYIFKTKHGEEISNTANVSIKIYEDNDIGSEINIIYLPENPEISAMAYMVELVHGAMNKKEKIIN